MKINRSHSRSQLQFQARLQAQRDAYRKDRETVDSLSVELGGGSSLFKSDAAPEIDTIDELVTAGNRTFENLDNVDFAGFRNNKELGQKTLRECREQVARFFPDTESEDYKEGLRRVLHARYLQGHGVQVQAHLDVEELAQLRKYVQSQTNTNNVADAVRAVNATLEDGEESVPKLLGEAEEYLFTERGVSEHVWESKFSRLDLKELGKVRDFSDAWSASQGGKFLTLAQGNGFNEMRNSMAREMLAAHGYEHVNALDLDTVLSLLRDIDAEGPRTQATIRETVDAAIAAGEQNYFRLNIAANRAILEELGVDGQQWESMQVSDQALREKHPDLSADETRAIRTRVLRDLLRVLPDEERALALQDLARSEADLISAEKVLHKHFGRRIREYSGYTVAYGQMGAMQRANLTSALSKLPQNVRSDAFDGPNPTTRDRLEKAIESRFGIEVHREAGSSVNGNASYDPFVKDWTVQGLADLYNAMESMSRDGKLPNDLTGNVTVSYMEGAPSYPSMQVGEPPKADPDPVGPWNRPGAWAHASGKSGYYGEASPDATGKDMIYLYDDALMGANGDSAVGLSIGEGTIIHEFGHAIQLGGTPGADKATRRAEDQKMMAEWSSLSRWMEPDQVLADGRMGEFEYYYDPTVQVGNRSEVATSYGASDPCEDFAEYTPFFYKDPETAMKLSAEKFLYLNDLVERFYSPQQISEIGRQAGLTESDLGEAATSMRKKVAAAPLEAGLKVG